MNDAKNAFRAGLVIIVGVAVALFFFVSSQKTNLDGGNSVSYYAYLTDASGVNAKSMITVAGLQVGEIQKIELVPVTVGELIADYDQRVQLVLDPTGLASKTIVVEKNDEFDAIIKKLVEKTGAKTPAEAASLKSEPLRVARLLMRVTDSVKLPTDTWVRKESLGVLGAKALFLELGRSPTVLKDGERIVNVRSMTGTDALLVQAEGIISDVRSITKKIDNDVGAITADVRGITGQLNKFINGDGDTPPLNELYKLVMTDLKRLTGTIDSVLRDAQKLIRGNDEQFSLMVANVQRITKDISDLTSAGSAADGKLVQKLDVEGKPVVDDKGQPVMIGDEGDLRATMRSVRQISEDLTSVTAQLKGLLGDNGDKVADGVVKLQETVTELNRTLTSLSEVAGRVERGEGTVGRLLTDEKMADKVELAVSGAADFVTGLTSLETHVDVGSWYNFNRERTTTTLSLKLQPKPDKFYLVEIVEDGGNLERFVRTERAGDDTRSSIREEDNQVRITAMFAKRFFDFLVLRAGLIETTGGVGANIFLFDDRFEIRSDVFGSRSPRDALVTDDFGFYLPRWRTVLKGQPIPHLYLSAGVDDVLNSFDPVAGQFRAYNDDDGYGFDWFVGVGLTFKDDDLRTILPFIPGG
ncbi:MAG: MlaD family protein [Deltaproteobacteria bacterium]|nr:MlaD family protein [Deltaproteobacteria bacterium]